MQIVRQAIAVSTLAEMTQRMFGNLVKAVVDVDQGIMAIDGEMHADEEALLLGEGSRQNSLWSVNLHPGQFGTPDFIELDSVINIRPSQGNRTRSVDDPLARAGHVDRQPAGCGVTQHVGMASGRWWTLTLAEQLANAGAEVGRAIRAKAAGDDVRFVAALDRCLELLDLTKADKRWTGPRLREIARVREVVCDFLVGDNSYGSTPESLDGYFMAFAFASRRGR